MNTVTKKIGLIMPANGVDASGFIQPLINAFPGVFELNPGQNLNGLGGLICFGDSPTGASLPTLSVTLSANVLENPRVKFGATDSVPAVFRNREVKQKQATVFEPKALPTGGEIIASTDGQPTWTVFNTGGMLRFGCVISARKSELPKHFFNFLAGGSFAEYLPVIDFIKRVGTEEGWTAPPLRAQAMFDDPNLHSLSYGWLDYPRLLKSAEEHNYHASFATIPLDTWVTNSKSAAFFKANAARISLLVHGNNHVKEELASFPSPDAAIAAMSQAWNRIRRLEQKTGVEVSKVVAAPHGACSEQTLEVLARLGYESACISHGSLYGHNKSRDWTARIGVAMAEMVAGTPVIPRFRVAYDCTNSILLAAYLDQPIIPVGHHQDVADGMKMLETVADFTNSIGPINWLDMKSISRGNYYTKRDGAQLAVRAFSRWFEIKIPAGVTELSLERPWLGKNGTEDITIQGTGGKVLSVKGYAGEALPVAPDSTVEITSIHPQKITPSPEVGGINLMAFARRQLCECRDRLRPHFGGPAGPGY